MAARWGIGGPSWTVTTPASGMGGAPSSAAGVTGRALQGRLSQPSYAAPQTPVAPIGWYFVLSSGTLAARSQITDGTYTFVVVGRVAERDRLYELERV